MEIFTEMASKTAVYAVLLVTIFSVSTANYVEALAAGSYDPSSSRVELRVALLKGYFSKYADMVSGQWVTDTAAVFTASPTEILEYCRTKYPNSDITNIVDSSQPATIGQWCPVNGDECTASAKITYYRCLVGPFESDALMVYNVCKFFHEHDENVCREPTYWKQRAQEDCGRWKMTINSTGMLLPCDVDRYKGVEYTCCPPAPTTTTTVTATTTTTTRTTTVEQVQEEEEEERGAEGQQETPLPERDNTVSHPREIISNILDDPYFSEVGLDGSQEKREYGAAKGRLSSKQKAEKGRVMQQWQEAQEHYLQLKAKDSDKAEKMRKEMTLRFEQTIGDMEAENAEENEELREAHQAHIEAGLKAKINSSYQSFKLAVEVGKPKARKILHGLKRYLHAVQKARQHYIRHYRHLRRTDPLKADQHKSAMLQMLSALNLDVAHALDKVQALPNLYSELKPKIDALLESTADSDDDVALIRAAEEEQIAEPTEPALERIDEFQSVEETVESQSEDEEEVKTGSVLEELMGKVEVAEKKEVEEEEQQLEETDQEQPSEEDVEEEEILTEEDTQAPALAKTATSTKTSASTTRPAKPSSPTKTRISTMVQTEPETPTPSRELELDIGKETEIQVPDIVPIIAVKPIESYLEEELDGPIETEVEKPKTLIVAQKPAAKVQKSAAAVRMEKQRLVNRDQENMVDTSVTKKRLPIRSEPMVAFGLACGVLAVATVLVIAVLIVRRKTRRTPVNNGFTEIDPNLTVEQRHIVSMQQNGYENPTYKYFDMQ
ncbi:amyloid-beta precursor-like protein [Diadema setosum]|uniref:amyloid-beta precursor-like protein n=1 Tax=Diadema setosum TaxID=31175 RepID=UPI003B3A26EE